MGTWTSEGTDTGKRELGTRTLVGLTLQVGIGTLMRLTWEEGNGYRDL